MANSYFLGQTVALTVAFTNAAGAPADPSVVRCIVEDPTGTETTYIYGVSSLLTRLGLGNYQMIVTGNIAGTWKVRWEGTTATTAAPYEYRFRIRPTFVGV